MHRIQLGTRQLYLRRREALWRRWCSDVGLGVVVLGCGMDELEEGDVGLDLRKGYDLRETWPLADGSVGLVLASHILEHLPDKEHSMRQLHRVLAHGGSSLIQVPSALGPGAFQDPTHHSYWVEESFAYYGDEALARYVWPAPPTFQVADIFTYGLNLPGTLKGRTVPCIDVHLVAVKGRDDQPPIPGPHHRL